MKFGDLVSIELFDFELKQKAQIPCLYIRCVALEFPGAVGNGHLNLHIVLHKNRRIHLYGDHRVKLVQQLQDTI